MKKGKVPYEKSFEFAFKCLVVRLKTVDTTCSGVQIVDYLLREAARLNPKPDFKCSFCKVGVVSPLVEGRHNLCWRCFSERSEKRF